MISNDHSQLIFPHRNDWTPIPSQESQHTWVDLQRTSSCYGQPPLNQPEFTQLKPTQPSNHQIWPGSISAHLYLCMYGLDTFRSNVQMFMMMVHGLDRYRWYLKCSFCLISCTCSLHFLHFLHNCRNCSAYRYTVVRQSRRWHVCLSNPIIQVTSAVHSALFGVYRLYWLSLE